MQPSNPATSLSVSATRTTAARVRVIKTFVRVLNLLSGSYGGRGGFDDEFDNPNDFGSSKPPTRYDCTIAFFTPISFFFFVSTTSASSKQSAESGFPSLGQPPTKSKTSGGHGSSNINNSDFGDFPAPTPKFQVVMSSGSTATTSSKPAPVPVSSGGFDDFTSFSATPAAPANNGFDNFDPFGSTAAPAAPASSGFASFAPANTGFNAFPAATPTSAASFNAFGYGAVLSSNTC